MKTNNLYTEMLRPPNNTVGAKHFGW